MKSSSASKLSLLGLILFLASAVTAAILPKNNTQRSSNGKLVNSTVGGGQFGSQSCVADPSAAACDYTSNSSTTEGPEDTSTSDAGVFDDSSVSNSTD